jgi:transcriptional regulator with PAS, ATPase and Fis domain
VFEKRALERENIKLKNENQTLRRDIGIKYHITNALGVSTASKELLQKVEHYAKSREIVLVLGESGTGKDDIARMIHYNSAWAANALILFDCSSVPADLHEVHLFGEETAIRGAYKVQGHAGLVEKAHMGTLVISHVHLLDRKSQSRLSAAIRNHESVRIGGSRPYYTDVRLIATSSPTEITKLLYGRWDLYDFLMENKIETTSLKARKEDIPLLAFAIAKRISQQLGKNITSIDRSAMETLVSYDFPGNYRELESLIEAAVMRCNEDVLKLEHLFLTPKKKEAK